MEEDKDSDREQENKLQNLVYEGLLINGVRPEVIERLPQIISRLISSNYNTDIIPYLDDETQTAIDIFTQLYRVMRREWNKYTNLVLIYTLMIYQRNAVPVITRFSGAYSMSKIQKKNDKIIYLISAQDNITQMDMCDDEKNTVVDFLNELILHTPKFLDIYLDFEPRAPTREEVDVSYTAEFIDNLSRCIPAVNRTNSSYQRYSVDCPVNVRVHLCDPWTAVELQWLSDILQEEKTGLYNNLRIHMLEFFDRAYSIDSETHFSEMCEEIISLNPLVMKELAKLGNKDMARTIVDSCISYAFNNGPGISYLRDIWRTFSKEQFENMPYKVKIKTVIVFLRKATAFLKNIYMMCRMFKRYNVDRVVSHQPEFAKNIVVYANSDHIRCCMYVLSELGYTILKPNDKGPKKSCLQLEINTFPYFVYSPVILV